MPRKFIKRWMPDHDTIRNHKSLQFLGTLLHDPNLFHLNRKSVIGAFTVGLFCAFIPLPSQMPIAAALAIWSRVNLPISVGLVWVTNPVTMPPIFYFCYRVGAWILQVPTQHVEFTLTITWLMEELGAIWEPFLFGCLVMGTFAALAGNITIRLVWRLVVVRSWQARLRKRRTPKSNQLSD